MSYKHPPIEKSQPTVNFVILMGISVMVTHSVGFWLFPALLPRMKESLQLDYDQIALMVAFTPCSYMLFCLFSGLLIPLVGSARMIQFSVFGSGLCMLAVAGSTQAWQVALALILIAGMAALHWTSLIDRVSRVVPVAYRNRALGLISGGLALGMCVNGLLISPLFSGWVWQELWMLCAGITLTLAVALWGFFYSNAGLTGPGIVSLAEEGQTAGSVSRLNQLKRCFRHRVAWLACLLSALIGLMTAPYMTYLNVYLSEDLGYAPVLASMTWNLTGLGGVLAGVGLGWLAERLGGPAALRFSLLLFLVGAVVLAFTPQAWLIPVAGITYGVLYFPHFGLIAGKFSRFFEHQLSLYLVSLSLVAFSLFSAVGNWAGGAIYKLTGSLTALYVIIAGIALLTLLLSLALPKAKQGHLSFDAKLL